MENGNATLKKKFNKDYIWAFSTYFTEGFPYAIIRSVSSVFFRDMKAPLSFIGLTSLFGIPWTLKFLWGPWADEYGTKKRWLTGMQAPLVVMMLLAALFIPLHNNVYWVYGLFFIGAFIAATNDIAIDGYYMEALDKDGQSKFIGLRTMAYRAAWMLGTGVIVTIGTTVGWSAAFFASALVFGLFYLYHLFFLNDIESPKKPFSLLVSKLIKGKTIALLGIILIAAVAIQYFFQSPLYTKMVEKASFFKKMEFAHWIGFLLLLAMVLVAVFRNRLKDLLLQNPDSQYSKAFISFMDRDKIGIILAFIMLLRFGEWTLANMVSPFIVDVGIKVHYGWLSAGVGLPASIIGAIFGGWMISRYSLKKLAFPFIFAQNITNIIYMLLAMKLSAFVLLNTGAKEITSIGTLNLVLVACTHGFDQFAGGLGSAVLTTYLMRICKKDFKAGHYAIGSALMNVTAPIAGVFSGIITQELGYAWIFGISFIVSIPAMVLMFFLPNLEEQKVEE